ncbi:MAG: translational GTPase TypA [Candidatus Margulisiibacteriota bacterium]|jgi:GTP-binding protein
MNSKKIRNIAIIAHVDHGKTTLVDQLFRQSGTFRDNQIVQERLMDSLDLERERGITIKSKTGACEYKDYRINIIDTPGHADFGGEVERVMNMADGVLFLVDAAEGPMPQSYFVLKKAVEHNLPIIVVVNKIDKQAARANWVINEVFDLLVKLNAPDELLDFPVIYASAKEGYANLEDNIFTGNMVPLFEQVVAYIPAPTGDPKASLQLQIATISYTPFMGRLAIGKITSGQIKVNQEIAIAEGDKIKYKSRVTKLFQFKSNQQEEITKASVGNLIAVAGIPDICIGDTLTDPDNPLGLPPIEVDPPTIAMTFIPNDSPFAGQEGEFVTSRHIKDRLERATLSDVALKVENLGEERGFKVSGRGELHLSILIENMRREGYEFQVSRPSVILKEENGKTLEPYEELTIDVDEALMGKVIEQLGERKGKMIDMKLDAGMARLIYTIPTRGLLGYQSEFLMATRGKGIMNYMFFEYGLYSGDIRVRKNGVLISKETCETVAYALCNLQNRGILFMGPGEKIYEGQIIGEHAREDDLVVNPAKGKKLTNMRASGSDDAVILVPYLKLSLEQYISYIDDTELVELTPKSIRLRKKFLSELQRKKS